MDSSLTEIDRWLAQGLERMALRNGVFFPCPEAVDGVLYRCDLYKAAGGGLLETMLGIVDVIAWLGLRSLDALSGAEGSQCWVLFNLDSFLFLWWLIAGVTDKGARAF